MIDNNDIYHLARIALHEDYENTLSMIKKIYRKEKKQDSDLAKKLESLLSNSPNNLNKDMRSNIIPDIPVDQDNRLEVLQSFASEPLLFEPVWNDNVKEELDQFIAEQKKKEMLIQAFLPVSKAVLFYGIPGVGKTLAAKWLAWKLNLPLLVLDLSAVISSYLGRTGNNIKNIFEYAKGIPCILLLDELDAIAKRRDDLGEIGELKRLVTVLIQEMDNWPEGNLLIAATNHPDLLDPAIWRRFDYSLQFKTPQDAMQIEKVLKLYLDEDYQEIELIFDYLIACCVDLSFNEIERIIKRSRRKALLMELPLDAILIDQFKDKFNKFSKEKKYMIVNKLTEKRLSQRKINEITGISRITIKKVIGDKYG